MTNECVSEVEEEKEEVIVPRFFPIKGCIPIEISSLKFSDEEESEEESDSELEEEDNSFNEIIPNLFLGDEFISKNIQVLKSLSITHILNAAQGPCSYEYVNTNEMFYKSSNLRCKFLGLPSTNIDEFQISNYFGIASAFIDDAISRTKNGKILVHSLEGNSRSATLVLAYLMMYRRLSAVDAMKLVRSKRNIQPNDGFLQQICDLEFLIQVAAKYQVETESEESESEESESEESGTDDDSESDRENTAEAQRKEKPTVVSKIDLVEVEKIKGTETKDDETAAVIAEDLSGENDSSKTPDKKTPDKEKTPAKSVRFAEDTKPPAPEVEVTTTEIKPETPEKTPDPPKITKEITKEIAKEIKADNRLRGGKDDVSKLKTSAAIVATVQQVEIIKEKEIKASSDSKSGVITTIFTNIIPKFSFKKVVNLFRFGYKAPKESEVTLAIKKLIDEKNKRKFTLKGLGKLSKLGGFKPVEPVKPIKPKFTIKSIGKLGKLNFGPKLFGKPKERRKTLKAVGRMTIVAARNAKARPPSPKKKFTLKALIKLGQLGVDSSKKSKEESKPKKRFTLKSLTRVSRMSRK